MDTKSYVYTPEAKAANRAAYTAATLAEFSSLAVTLKLLLANAASKGVATVPVVHAASEQQSYNQGLCRVHPNGARDYVLFVNPQINLSELKDFLSQNGFEIAETRSIGGQMVEIAVSI